MNDDAATVLDDLREFVPDLAPALVEIVERADPGELAPLMLAIRQARADLAGTYDLLERALVGALEGARHFVVPGIGELEVKRRTVRRAWDHDALIPAIVSRVADEPGVVWNPDTGEMLPPSAIGTNVAARLRDCVSFGAGKVRGLRAIGIQVDEFCEETRDGYSVTIPTPPRSHA